MKKQKGLGLIVVLLIITALILTAGGVVGLPAIRQVWHKKASSTPAIELKPTVGGPVAPGLSEGVKDLPTAAPTFITLFPESSSKVQILVSKSIYQKGETIIVSVKNTNDYQLGYYDCPGPKGGVVWFERKRDQAWEEEISLADSDYGSKRPCYPRFLEAGQELQKRRHISTEVPTGSYHAVFGYIDGKVYSNEFQIL